MRLRLSVQRHRLPKAEVLWSVPEDEKSGISTVSKLLEQINDIIPLESDAWGLEDYVVRIGAFECLHFARVDEILKDEDVVSIRPLTTEEIRSRTRSGRYQISCNGQHLVDGIPFGKSYIRKPTSRPKILIPPRESAGLITDGSMPVESEADDTLRLTNGAHGGDEDEFGGQHAGSSGVMQNDLAEDESEEDDEFIPEDDDEDDESTADSVSSEEPEVESTVPAKRRLAEVNGNKRKLRSDTEAERECCPSGNSSSSGTKRKRTIRFNKMVEVGDNGLQPLAGSSDEENEDEGNEVHATSKALAREVAPEPESRKSKRRKLDQTKHLNEGPLSAMSGQDTTEHDSASKSTSSNSIGVDPEEPVIPGEGTRATRQRNIRKRQQKKRQKLIDLGILPKDASYGDLAAYEDQTAKGTEPSSSMTMSMVPRNVSMKVSKASKPTVPNGTESFASASKAGPTASASILKPSPAPVSFVISEALPNGLSGNVAGDVAKVLGAVKTAKDTPSPIPDQGSGRGRLDIPITRRLLFGSLGVRNPKSKEEEEKLRLKFANPPKVGPHIGSSCVKPCRTSKAQDAEAENAALTEATEAEAEATVAPESEAWRTKITVSAVECVDEGVELSEPPYPFKQRWDVQYAPVKPKKNKKKKRPSSNEWHGSYVELDYGEADESYGDLNYDAEPTDVQEIASEGMFPLLPTDVSLYPVLGPALLDKPGLLIVFKELEMSAATDWAPRMSGWKSARTIRSDAAGLVFQLSPKDREKRADPSAAQFDEKGRRLLSKFETPMFDDDDDIDDGIRTEVKWSELVEARILKPFPGDEWPECALSATASLLLEPATSNETNGANDVDAGAEDEWNGFDEETKPEDDEVSDAMDIASVTEIKSAALLISREGVNGGGVAMEDVTGDVNGVEAPHVKASA